MATKILLLVVLIITSVVAYATNARSLSAAKAKATADEQNEYFQLHGPLSPFFGSFGGLRGGIRPPFAGIGGFGGGIGGAFGSGFGPFVGSGGTSSAGAGTGSSINEGFEDNGGNNPNDNIDAGDLGEGGDAAIKNDMHP